MMGKFLVRNKKEIAKYLFLLPGFTGICRVILIPFGDVVFRSFRSAMSGQWRGLENYRLVLENDAFRLACSNTFRFLGMGVPLLLVLSLGTALLIYKSTSAHHIKTLYLLPLAMPAAAVTLIWKLLFCRQGFLNELLGTHISFMDTEYAFLILVGSYIWKNLGYTLVLWIAGLNAISPELNEAAKVDGAGGLDRKSVV